MPRPSTLPWLRYGVAVVAVLVAMAARMALDPVLGDRFPFATLFFAVLVAAWYGGSGPALLATGLGALASAWILLPPRHQWAISGFANQGGLILYLSVGSGIAWLGGAMRAAWLRAEVAAEEAFRQHEQMQVTLASIGDAVIATDAQGRVTWMNRIAEGLTGWSAPDAREQPLSTIFRIINEVTGGIVDNPATRAIREGGIVGLANHTVLIARDGTERSIEDSAGPIRDAAGRIIGAVLVFRDVSEHRRAEEARQRLAAIVESSDDAILGKTLEGIITSWNRGAARLYGYEPVEVIGKPVSVLIPPERLGELSGVMDRLRRGEAIDHYETVRRRKDGTLLDISVSISPIRGASGRLVGASTIARDITERKRAELALRESERRFRDLADALPQLVWTARADGTVDFFNARWYDYTGLSPEEARDSGGWESAIHPDDRAGLERASGCLGADDRGEAEIRVRHRSGAFRWHLARVVPVLDADGRVLRRFGTATDIEVRWRSEHAAQFLAGAGAILAEPTDEESILKQIAQSVVPFFADWCAIELMRDDGVPREPAVAHIDPAKVAYAVELRRRYPPEPAADRGAAEVLRTGEPQLVPQITDEMLVATARDEDHLCILRHLGLRSYMGVPIRARGRTLGTILFVAAESGRRFGADDLRLAEELATRVGVAVENTRQHQALKQADRRKDEFLATVAHELRNPLASLRNALRLMGSPEQTGPGDDFEAERAMAERQVTLLARLVEDLMDVARITQEKLDLRTQVVDLRTIVERAVESVRSIMAESNHNLIVSLSGDEMPLQADPTRLEQVLRNLLSNAAKYTEPGGRIRLEARRDDRRVTVTVADSGIGIPPERLPHIFEMFYQAERRMDRTQGGLGIGLGLVKRLVELHGGTITARSGGTGLGSEFAVALPLLGSVPAPEDPVETQPSPRSQPERDVSRHRILVVDDNQDAANSLARLLELLFHQEVRVAHDGPKALALAGEFHPDLILLDLSMPGMDGYEVARRLKNLPEPVPRTVVALTGWGQESDRDRWRDAGFDRYLVKPVDLEALKVLLGNSTSQ